MSDEIELHVFHVCGNYRNLTYKIRMQLLNESQTCHLFGNAVRIHGQNPRPSTLDYAK